MKFTPVVFAVIAGFAVGMLGGAFFVYHRGATSGLQAGWDLAVDQCTRDINNCKKSEE